MTPRFRHKYVTVHSDMPKIHCNAYIRRKRGDHVVELCLNCQLLAALVTNVADPGSTLRRNSVKHHIQNLLAICLLGLSGFLWRQAMNRLPYNALPTFKPVL